LRIDGLLVGGVPTQAIGWHWIFFVDLPIGLGTAHFARRLLEADDGIGLDAGAGVPGPVLSTGALIARRLRDRRAGPAPRDRRPRAGGCVHRPRSTAATPLIFRSRNVLGANILRR
jgi:hypothetical protein